MRQIHGRIGGIAGATEGTINNNYNKTDLDIISTSTNVSYIGGISGVIMQGSLNNCYNRGDIFVTSNNVNRGFIGGITGGSVTNSILFNLYNFGNINIYGTFQEGLFVGGIIGDHRKSTLENGCNIGNIISNPIVTGDYNEIGLIAGLNAQTGVITSSYYLSELGLKAIGTDWGISEITAIDELKNMPTILEIVGNAFKEDDNNINNGYPILSWQ